MRTSLNLVSLPLRCWIEKVDQQISSSLNWNEIEVKMKQVRIMQEPCIPFSMPLMGMNFIGLLHALLGYSPSDS